MKILIDENNHIVVYEYNGYSSADTDGYVFDPSYLIECVDFPINHETEWNHFQTHYKAYKYIPFEAPSQDYEMTEKDSLSQFVYDKDYEEVIYGDILDKIRNRRKIYCFKVINRGPVWFNLFTADQQQQIRDWYQAWLDAPQTLVIPETPSFLI